MQTVPFLGLEPGRDALHWRLPVRDTRLAMGRQRSALDGTAGDGRSALWARVPELDPSAALLGLLGDYVPFGISQAVGMHAGGNP